MPNVDPGVTALFGSETRAATLGALANEGQPLTAYRIAKMTGGQVIKAITELRRLERAGIVTQAVTERGRVGWVLPDGSLKDFLRQRIRIVWASDWDREVIERVRRRRNSSKLRIDLSRFPPAPGAIPNPEEFLRRPEKDRILARAGLRVSRRGRTDR
jgi:hypothetical protein